MNTNTNKSSDSIIDFKQCKDKLANKDKQKILHLELYREQGSSEFQYYMRKKGKVTASDDFIVFALTSITQDILEYGGDPLDLIEATQTIIAKLGYSRSPIDSTNEYIELGEDIE
jgi:hypothetical protein